MDKNVVISIESQNQIADPLTTLLRSSASALLQAAIEVECQELLSKYDAVRDLNGRRAVVRNGHLPERKVLTGLGPIAVEVPRVRDRTAQGIRFESKLTPPYVRRANSVDAVLPWLYLKGISQADVGPALEALLGPNVGNVSSSVISKLKQVWLDEYREWNKRDLSSENWVYVWADGVYSGLRADEHRLCALVIIGVNERGQKHFLAIDDGVRESKQSWREVLLGLKQRGMRAPRSATGDGALGFWAALDEIYPETRHQRCWVHKTANVLNYLPKSVQSKAKSAIQAIWMADTRANANIAFDAFLETYGAKYPKAAQCISKDREPLLAFYDFPAEHWIHLRTSNVIESTFATIRHRTDRVKGAFSRDSMLSMLYKLALSAEQSFRRIKGFNWLAEVIRGVKFVDGVKQDQQLQAA